MDLPEDILKILTEFDKNGKGFREHEVTDALKPLIPDDRATIEPVLLAEAIAFEFYEENTNETLQWGTYFGPYLVHSDGKGKVSVSPSIDLLSPQVIDHWDSRISEVHSPILKARYAGLVWDFSDKIKKEKPDYRIAHTYIDSLLLIAENRLQESPHDVIKKLKRALSLSISMNDRGRTEMAKKSIIKYEESFKAAGESEFWGYAFDLLIGNDKINLTEAEENCIIEDLEVILAKKTVFDLSKKEDADTWGALNCGTRLVNYYRKKNDKEKVRRVVLLIGKTFIEGYQYKTALQESGSLETVYRLYKRYNLIEESLEILKKLHEIGQKSTDELITYSQTFNIPKEKLAKHWQYLSTGDNQTIIHKTVQYFIPTKEELNNDLRRHFDEVPLEYIITTSICDAKGRIIAKIGSLKDDPEGHLIKKISDHLYLSAPLLRITHEKLVNEKNLDTQTILAFLSQSPVIVEERCAIIKKGLEAFFANDFIVATHILIPCIEDILRNILEENGGTVIKKGKHDGFDYLSLDSMLIDPIMKNILTEDFTLYLRALLTDPRGWNLRNEICHGIIIERIFHPEIADRVVHALLCLGLIRKSEEPNT